MLRGLTLLASAISVLQIAGLLWLLGRLPGEPPPLDAAAPADVTLRRLDAIERTWLARMPPLTDRFATWRRHEVDERLRAVRRPSAWAREHTTPAERVRRLDEALRALRRQYLQTAWLLVAAAGLCAAGFWWALRHRGLGPPLVALGGCLLTTPVLTEPLAGMDFGLELAPLLAVQTLAGAALLVGRLRAAGKRWMQAPLGRGARWVVALAPPALLGGLGTTLIFVGLDERLPFLVELGAGLLASAVAYPLVSLLALARRRRAGG